MVFRPAMLFAIFAARVCRGFHLQNNVHLSPYFFTIPSRVLGQKLHQYGNVEISDMDANPEELYREKEFRVTKLHGGEVPLPDFLQKTFPVHYPSMSRARKAVRKRKVFLNGKRGRCGDAIREGDVLLFGPGWQPSKKKKRRDDLVVIYEDDHVAIVDKPTGVSVHGHGGHSLAPNLGSYLRPAPPPLQTGVGDGKRDDDAAAPPFFPPAPVHRLDAPTGGLLAVAKTRAALRFWSEEFELRRAKKKYVALIVGKLEGSGSIEEPLDGKECLTHYVVQAHTRSRQFGWLTEVDLYPETGRKHQLRRHLAGLGHPILGDLRYCPPGFFGNGEMHGLFLWATELRLRHPLDPGGDPQVYILPRPNKILKATTHHQNQYEYDIRKVQQQQQQWQEEGGGAE